MTSQCNKMHSGSPKNFNQHQGSLDSTSRQETGNEEQRFKREDEELGEGLGIEGSQIIRNNFFFFESMCLAIRVVRRAIITQRKLGICCKFRWEFYPKTSFFPLCSFAWKFGLWLISGWISDISPWREKHSHQILLPLKWREKKILYPIIRAWADKLAPLFFFLSRLPFIFC